MHSAPDKTEVEEINFLPADFKAEGGTKAIEETGATEVIEHKEDQVNGGAELTMQEGPVNPPVKMMDTLNMETCHLSVRSGGIKICSF